MINKKQAGSQNMTTIALACSNPTTPVSGDPVRYGERCGVAMINERTDGLTTIDISTGIFTLSVQGINGSGNSAVAAGDLIYYVDGNTPKLSKVATGRLFGMALEAVGSSLTATIRVLKFGW